VLDVKLAFPGSYQVVNVQKIMFPSREETWIPLQYSAYSESTYNYSPSSRTSL